MSSGFTPIQIPDPELVSQLKEKLPEALLEKLNGSLSILQDRVRFAEYKVRVLEERLRLVRIEKYGPGSEKLSDDQLELLELEPGVSSAEVAAESQRQQLELPLKQARKHPGRQQLPAELPRVEQIIACTADQCVCGKCGKETTVRPSVRGSCFATLRQSLRRTTRFCVKRAVIKSWCVFFCIWPNRRIETMAVAQLVWAWPLVS